jgi:alpha-L-rhamnosidase
MRTILFAIVLLQATAHALTVGNLRCEHLPHPLGIDTERPRLSWQLLSDEPGAKQTAYQIVAENLWDSGKVLSDQSIEVCYGGLALQSGQRVTWKVRVWDEHDKPSDWSRDATWTMGLLKPEDWRAKWIGAPVAELPPVHPSVASGRWISGADSFRNTLAIPEGRAVRAAQFRLVGDAPLELFVNDKSAGRAEKIHTFDVAALLKPGENALGVNLTGGQSCCGQLVAKLDDGSVLILPTDGKWKTGDKKKPAKMLGRPSEKGSLGFAGETAEAPDAAPLLRKNFALDKKIKRATAYVSGLGYYELYLNGAKVGDHVLDPAFTRYDRRALYVTYDVTTQLRRGANAVGVMLGNGWYNYHVNNAWDFDNAPWRDKPKMIFQLAVEFTDGTTSVIASDESWKYSTGAIRWDGLMSGETYDARLEKPGWDTADCDDSAWAAAKIVPAPKGILSAQTLPPIRVTETITPVTLTEPKPGVYVFDVGRNIAGTIRLRVRGAAGAEIKLRYGEMLHDDGTLDQQNISPHVYNTEFQTDRYILKGAGVETWQPRFQYHGFQYVEVTGFPGKPLRTSLVALVAHTDLESAGSFECSNELLNKIQQATRASYLNNFHGHPTDCPQREKNGWTGDAHLACEAGLYNFNAIAAYEHWMRDFRDEQRDSGELPGIVPTGGWGYAWGNGPAWDSAGVLIPANLHLFCGDTRIIADQYDLMKRYVDYLGTRAKSNVVAIGLGDWCPAKTKTPEAITSTAYYHEDAAIVAWAATRLGRTDDATKYTALVGDIRLAFQREFPELKTQTALACAIYQDMLEPARVRGVVDTLVAAVHASDNHLDCGILGTKYLLHALSDNGHADLAYKIATQTTPPGWGAWIERGATTFWESWQNWGGGDSRNHVMFGDISAWCYKVLAGIRPDPAEPGFKHVLIKPEIVGDLKWVKARHDSPYGRIAVAWQRDGSDVKLNVTIPPNTTATVFVPGKAEPVDVVAGTHRFRGLVK